MTVQNPPIFLQASSHPAEDVRRFIAAATRDREGILTSTDLAVTEKSGTPDMSVDVAGGRAFILGDEATYQGTYFVENRGTTNVSITAADGTNARKDLIVARVKDTAYSGATDAWELSVVTGTPAASPAEPATPNNAIVLALVDVPASDTSIENAQITDRRTLFRTPAVKAQRTTTQSFTNATWTSHAFTAADLWDTDDMHDTSTNNTRLTVPSGWGGRYLLTAHVTWDANGNGGRWMGYRIDGGTDMVIVNADDWGAGVFDIEMNMAVEIEVDGGSYVELRGYQTSGGALNALDGWAALRWLGP